MATLIRRNALALTAVFLSLVLMLIILLILTVARGNLENKIQTELHTGFRVFSSLLEDRSEQLASHVKLLASDLRFQQSIAKHAITRNDQEIMRWLRLHQESVKADLALLVDSQGRTLPADPVTLLPNSLLSQLTQGMSSETAVVTAVNGRLYQMVFAPLQHERWRAWVGIGFELNQPFLQRVSAAAGMHLSLMLQQENQVHWLSTLPVQLLTAGAPDSMPGTLDEMIQNLESYKWQSLSQPQHQSADTVLWPVISVSAADEYQSFATLRRLLLASGLLSLILTAVVTLWLRRRLDQTLETFAAAAQHIAQGNYRKPVDLSSSSVRWLESALNKIQRSIQEREHHLNFHVRHDPLTGLPNKHHLEARVGAKLNADNEEKPLLLLIIQIRRLTQLRHIYERSVVDSLIKAVATRAKALMAEGDVIGRLEDDQFLLYLDDFQEAQLATLRRQLINLFRRPLVIEHAEFHLDVTVGAVFSFWEGLDYTDLLRRGKLALEQANRNQSSFELYRKGQDDVHLRRARITYSIPGAVQDNEFQLVYQPQLNLKHGAVQRVEALLRWPNSKLGNLSPAEFIPLAERTGQIGAITCWIISSVARQLTLWRQEGLGLEVSINLSAHDLIKDDVILHLTDCLTGACLNPALFTLEVTESTMIQQPDKTIQTLRGLQEQGFKLAMDDFGTGFSSLSQIKALPLQELKIDQSFVLNVAHDKEDQTIVRAAIEMAHTLGLEVIAEGVENSSSLEMLRALGCDGIQGNYLAKPMKQEELTSWLLALSHDKNLKDGPVAWAGIA